ncbi:MAG: CRTAC1 family protein [Verrucomicrobiales bacterium]|nr:CRTAC1 family protein [Verrucomicrobiales bacterium]
MNTPPMNPRAVGIRLALILLVSASTGGTAGAQETYSVQDDAQTRVLLREAAAAQSAGARTNTVFHGFHLVDRQPGSGITFTHHMTDDSGRSEKAIHYDHGSGVAAADVDGDGRLDLYFGNQIGGNQLWRNKGGGKFENITDKAGVAVPGRVTSGVAFADLDNDGDPDLIVATVRDGNVLLENLGGGRFRDVTATAGWNARWHSSGIVVLDFNRDGRPDVLITSIGRYTTDTRGRDGYWIGMTNAFSGHLFPERSEPCVLYRNDGNLKFTEVAAPMNLTGTGWCGDASSCDINDDGWPDLYLLNMQGDDHVFVNVDGQRFEDRAARYFPKTPWGAMGIAVFDYNLDGRFDYLITDMHSDMTSGQSKLRRALNAGVERLKSEAWCSATWTDAFLQGAANNLFGNALYENLGEGRFSEVSDRLHLETYWPWGVSIGDVNADGFEDVFVTAGMGYPFSYSLNSLLLNEEGREFRDAEFLVGVEPRRDGRVSKESFVLDLDGADRNHPLAQGRKGKLSVRSSLSTRSAAFVDLDDDGDLDLVTNEFDDVPQVMINDLSARRSVNFLKVRLVGTTSNREGLGATVRVNAGTRTLSRFLHGKSGYLGQSSLPLYYGLGDAAQADRVEVLWPSGRKQVVTGGIPRNGLLTLREPESGQP